MWGCLSFSKAVKEKREHVLDAITQLFDLLSNHKQRTSDTRSASGPASAIAAGLLRFEAWPSALHGVQPQDYLDLSAGRQYGSGPSALTLDPPRLRGRAVALSHLAKLAQAPVQSFPAHPQ